MPELTLADYDRLGGIGVPKPDSDLPIDIGAKKPPLLTRLVAWVRRKFAAQPETQRTEAPRRRRMQIERALCRTTPTGCSPNSRQRSSVLPPYFSGRSRKARAPAAATCAGPPA